MGKMGNIAHASSKPICFRFLKFDFYKIVKKVPFLKMFNGQRKCQNFQGINVITQMQDNTLI